MARTHQAGAFDIRRVIGALLSTYGVILVVMGLVADTAPEKTGGVNANLWGGLALLAVGVGFLAWARLNPVVVPERVPEDDRDAHRAPDRFEDEDEEDLRVRRGA